MKEFLLFTIACVLFFITVEIANVNKTIQNQNKVLTLFLPDSIKTNYSIENNEQFNITDSVKNVLIDVWKDIKK